MDSSYNGGGLGVGVHCCHCFLFILHVADFRQSRETGLGSHHSYL